jgi:hypothetical protein
MGATSKTVPLLCIALAACGGQSAPLDPSALTSTVTAALPPRPAVMDHDATYTVHVKIQPGRWHTEGPRGVRADGVQVAPKPCRWTRGFIGVGADTQTAIDSGEEYGPVDVEIGPADGVFTTSGCRPWRPVG